MGNLMESRGIGFGGLRVGDGGVGRRGFLGLGVLIGTRFSVFRQSFLSEGYWGNL